MMVISMALTSKYNIVIYYKSRFLCFIIVLTGISSNKSIIMIFIYFEHLELEEKVTKAYASYLIWWCIVSLGFMMKIHVIYLQPIKVSFHISLTFLYYFINKIHLLIKNTSFQNDAVHKAYFSNIKTTHL